MMQERNSALYNKVKDLHEQAKSIWKGVLFEILLDPINPEPGEIAERHIIDYRDCVEDFELTDGEPDREYSLDELFKEIGKLRDYKNILKAANESIENIKEQYKDKYTVTLIRVLDYSNQEDHDNLDIDIFESDSEYETEVEEDGEPEEEWDGVWESDSGVESPAEYEQQPHLYSSDESEIDVESDSGLQTESEAEWLLNWESGSESDRPSTPEPNQEHRAYQSESDEELKLALNQNEDFILNWESDSDSNTLEPSLNLLYESDEEIKSEPSLNEKELECDDKISELLSLKDTSKNVTLKSKEDNKRESIYKPRLHQYEEEFISFGLNCTSLSKSTYEIIPWNTAKSAASALLLFNFGEKVPRDDHLNQQILADICTAICSKFNISEHEAHRIIETECTDIQNKLKCT